MKLKLLKKNSNNSSHALKIKSMTFRASTFFTDERHNGDQMSFKDSILESEEI